MVRKKNNPNPRIYTYAKAIAELLLGSESDSDKLIDAKFEALRRAFSFTEMYAREGFSEVILDTIMEKKAEMILKSNSVKDIREISNPPKPHYDGNQWYASKNSVPEEEMICWSMASLKAPLSYEAVRRYEELFKQFYGKSIEEIIAEEEFKND